jgi:hypothetical protein
MEKALKSLVNAGDNSPIVRCENARFGMRLCRERDRYINAPNNVADTAGSKGKSLFISSSGRRNAPKQQTLFAQRASVQISG